jgi:hypothetical protein
MGLAYGLETFHNHLFIRYLPTYLRYLSNTWHVHQRYSDLNPEQSVMTKDGSALLGQTTGRTCRYWKSTCGSAVSVKVGPYLGASGAWDTVSLQQ